MWIRLKPTVWQIVRYAGAFTLIGACLLFSILYSMTASVGATDMTLALSDASLKRTLTFAPWEDEASPGDTHGKVRSTRFGRMDYGFPIYHSVWIREISESEQGVTQIDRSSIVAKPRVVPFCSVVFGIIVCGIALGWLWWSVTGQVTQRYGAGFDVGTGTTTTGE